jgi:TM2 domain-containing membrane protein YozV
VRIDECCRRGAAARHRTIEEQSMTDPQYPQYPQPAPGPGPAPGAGYPAYPTPAPGPGYAPTPGYPAHPGGVPVAAKSPGLALIASFFIPGLGSMMNGEVGKGVGILVGYLVSWVLTLVLIGVLGLFAFWIFGMVDAYNGARNWNLRHGIYS